VLEPPARFDLQDQAEVGSTQRGEARLQLTDVFSCANERIADNVCASDDKLEIIEILRRERWQSKVRLRKVDALVGRQLGTAGFGVSDGDLDALRALRPNDPANLTVVEPDRLTAFYIIEDLYAMNRGP
jgi:hypothetical protein